MQQRVFIETYGCQMNVADTELMYGLLRHDGFTVAETADEADVVLINTCAVRERAEERVLGRLGRYKAMKRERPDLVLGITGCMAERMKETLVEKAPHLDLVVGPDAYRRLPNLVERARDPDSTNEFEIDVRLDKSELYEKTTVDRVPGVSGWISVQRGCDKFCSFCIVPFVRGRERSLPPDEVVDQAREMRDQGFREVTLLGQTVSSYYERGCDFAELLERVHQVEGLERIRYTSPYPNDFSDRLLETLAALPRVGRHIHLPVQSGSTRLLKDMRRGYSAERFLDLIGRVRRILPRHALSTDIIVGYPGETEEEFEMTLDLVREVRFDSAFMFIYSEREGTLAARRKPDNIPIEVKKARLARLIELQESISKAEFAKMVGQEAEILVQGPSRRNPNDMIGRTSCFRSTILPEMDVKPGELVPVRIVGATSHTLMGEPLSR